MTRVARVYDDPGPDDGLRVLVDRLWPRGVRKVDPRIDEWWQDLAPSTELRRWYGHDPERYDEFAARYRAELDDPDVAAALERARAAVAGDGLTLLTATREVTGSHLGVLASVIDTAWSGRGS